MAVIAIQTPTLAGAVISTAAASGGGDTIEGTGDVILQVVNGGGGSITVTVAPTKSPLGLTLASAGGAVAAGATKWFGPFPQEFFNNAAGLVAITYSGVTSVTVAAMRVRY